MPDLECVVINTGEESGVEPDGTIVDTTAGVVGGDWLNRNIEEHLGT